MTSSRKSKGQLQQVFLFLMAVIVVIATIFLGMKLFDLLSGTACEATDAEFRAQMKRALDEHSVFGSRGTVEVQAPCDAVTVCFVDTTVIGTGGFTSEDPVITAVVNNDIKTNIFLRKEAGMMEAGYDERIVVNTPGKYTCFNEVRGTFSFRTEGQGRFIEVYEGTT